MLDAVFSVLLLCFWSLELCFKFHCVFGFAVVFLFAVVCVLLLFYFWHVAMFLALL